MPDQSESSLKKYFKVAVLVFHGVDILDFAGPMEIFSHVSHNQNPDAPDRVYRFSVIGRDDEIRAASCLNIKTDIAIDHIAGIDSNCVEPFRALADFDMLIVPGGPPSIIMPLLDRESPEMRLIRAFSSLPSRGKGWLQDANITATTLSEQGQPRCIFSVCTGAFFLGSLGLLADIPCTTHHRALQPLSRICGLAAPSHILEKRYVDGGLCRSTIAQPDSLRVVTAGGISSGLDASLWVIAQQMGPDVSKFVARVMEYDGQWEEDRPRGDRKF
jgi:transcriptional regulator GlxA family with amidase domain